MTDLIIKLLQRAAISTVDKQDLHLQLLSHGDYPSLKAITDALDYFGIENVAANVPKDALGQLPKSFLGLLEVDDVSQLVFVSHYNGYVKTIDEAGKKKKLSVASFQDVWTGTIIAIEVLEKEKRNVLPKISLSTIAVALAIASMIGVVFFREVNMSQSVYLSLGVIGLVLSYLILKESQGEGSALTAKVCNALSTNTKGCSAVINNKNGKISKGVGLGDVSLMFFLSTVIIGIYLGVNESAFLIVAGLTLPVVAYTIYAQAFIIKDWCFLCLGITAVLLSQFVVLLSAFTDWDFSFQYTVSAISIMFVMVIGWLFVKPLLESKKELTKAQKNFLSLKREEAVFEALLEKNRIKNLIEAPEDAQIYFGNKDAALQLTAYTNPLCGFCTAAFEDYDALRMQFPEDVGISFIFYTPPDDENPGTIISKRIVEMYSTDAVKAWQGLRDWFMIKDIGIWIEKYGESSSMLLKHNSVLETHRLIAESNSINYTPETLIGESKLPRSQYDYKDIALFINYFREKNGKITALEAV